MDLTVKTPLEIEIGATVKYTPAWAGVMYYPDGSGAPPEPAEVEVLTVWLVVNGGHIPLTSDQADILLEDEVLYEALVEAGSEQYEDREEY